MLRVLVVDDDDDVRPVIRRALVQEGFDVVEAGTGADALARAGETNVDVAILDLNLPDMSGFAVLAELREAQPQVYVIMLTGADAEVDRVRGLVSGADDYVVKPFSARELAARVMAVERRQRVVSASPIEFGTLRIEPSSRSLSLAGQDIELTRREFDLLAYLAARPRCVFSREHLLEAVWRSSARWQQPATVTEHVRRLRSKIEIDRATPQWIVTVRGGGYRFEPSPQASAPELLSGAANAHDATVVVADMTVRFASPAALKLLGAAELNQVVGRDVMKFIAPASVAAMSARGQSVERGRWPRPEFMTIHRADDSEVIVELASVPVLWEGEPASQMTLWNLAEDTTRVRALATGIRTDVPDAVVVTTADQRIISFNAAAEELYGWREAEVVGRPLHDVVPWMCDDAERDRIGGEVLDVGRWHGAIVQRRRDGAAVSVRCSLTLLRDGVENPVGVISVARPVADGGASADSACASDDVLGEEIRRGVANDEFTVVYQPIIRLDDRTLDGVEALVRWAHPERGMLVPAAFIGAAERSGSIIPLGEHVLRAACRQAGAWRHAGHDVNVAVNLSARQLVDHDLPSRLGDLLAATSMPPDTLWLEVTETSLVEDLDRVTAILHRIDELGVRVAIDDFGTGWASLTYLRQFPVHAIKIDRSFVAGLGRNPRDAAIVSSMISLGHELDLKVVAEGVETEDQHRVLSDLGCELGQGYLYGHPQPPQLLDIG